MTRSLSCLAGVLCTVLLASCGGDSKPPVGKSCVMNSECANPLSCTFGKCHAACAEARDCAKGELCVKSPAGAVCQQQAEAKCAYKSECPVPLTCAIDRQCRTECLTTADCPTKTQKCIAPGVCAEPEEVDPTGMTLKNAGSTPVPEIPDGGLPDMGATGGSAGGGGGTGGAGGATGGSGGDASVAPGTDGPPSTMPVPVSGVTIDKMIVRQGEVGINATVTATGGGLSNPTNIEIGGPMGCRGTPMDGATDTMFVIRISCGHGVPLGPKDLKFQTAKGIGMHPALLTVSAITASPTGADTNRGTSDNPFRSFKKALSVADKGDIVELKDGTYDKEGGEDFMAPIPSGITILGQSAAGTKLVGPPDTNISVDGIKLREAGPLTVKNLTLAAFQQGINLDKAGDLTLENVKVTRSRQQGVYVYYAMGEGTKFNWTGAESEISDNGSYAVQIYAKNTTFNYKSKGPISSTAGYVFYVNVDDSTIVLEDTTLTSAMTMPTAQVLSLSNAATAAHKVTLTNVTLNGQSDIGGKDKTEVTMTNTTLNLPSSYSGTHLDFTGAKLTISKSTFNGGGTQLYVHSGEVTVRDTKFKDYYYYGVHVATTKKLDLGNMTQPGFAEFTPNPMYASSYAIYDTRAADLNPVTVRDATVSGNLIPSATYEGPGMQGPPRSLYIQTAKNQIIVY